MSGVVISVEGAKEVLQAFSRLSAGVQKKYLGASVRAVVKGAVPEVKALTPKGPTGNLRRSVRLKLEKKKTTTATGLVGYRRSGNGQKKTERGFHAFWIEEGTKDRTPSGKALMIPMAMTAKYPYLKGVVSRIGGEGGGQIFLRRARGVKGTGRFRAWADANLPRMRSELIARLKANLSKAVAEQERRNTRR